MKKLFCLGLCFMLCLCTLNAFAVGKLNVVQENFHSVPSYSTYGYTFAKVENTGDKPIKVNAGVLEIYDAAGEVITSTDYLQAYAKYLEPGQYTYVSMYDEIKGADTGVVADDYSLTLTGKSDHSYTNLRLPCITGLALNVKDDWWVHNYMYATVTNNTNSTLYDISVVLALLDAQGNILCIEDERLYDDCGLTPSSSIVIRKDISSSFVEYLAANQLVPTAVDAIAYVEIAND